MRIPKNWSSNVKNPLFRISANNLFFFFALSRWKKPLHPIIVYTKPSIRSTRTWPLSKDRLRTKMMTLRWRPLLLLRRLKEKKTMNPFPLLVSGVMSRKKWSEKRRRWVLFPNFSLLRSSFFLTIIGTQYKWLSISINNYQSLVNLLINSFFSNITPIAAGKILDFIKGRAG